MGYPFPRASEWWPNGSSVGRTRERPLANVAASRLEREVIASDASREGRANAAPKCLWLDTVASLLEREAGEHRRDTDSRSPVSIGRESRQQTNHAIR